MDIEQESKIIRRILSGDHEAYALLVENYKGPVYNLAYRLTGRHQDEEDLAQEIFIRAFEALERFNETKNFFPWLYTIALNVIRNHKKKKTPVPVRDIENPVFLNTTDGNESLTSDEIVRRKQEAEILAVTIQKLPTPQQEAVVFRYYQELTFEEIAHIQGVSLGAAKMRVYRGLKQLAEWMTK